MKALLADIRRDFAANHNAFTWRRFLFHLVWHGRFNALILIRAFLALQKRGLPTEPVGMVLRSRYQIELMKPCEIGTELFLPHPFGIVVTMGSKIGARVSIYGLVRLVGAMSGAPTVEDGAFIGDGARLVGGVTVGANSIIGAGAVVTKSVPANAVAAGVPAQVLRERSLAHA